MHEFAIVEDVVGQLLEESAKRRIGKIAQVQFRRGSAFSDEALQQAFETVTADTPAAGAELKVEVVNLDHDCDCGHKQVITSDDLEGHMFICPGCGAIRQIDESRDLELIGFTSGDGDDVTASIFAEHGHDHEHDHHHDDGHSHEHVHDQAHGHSHHHHH